VYPPTKKLFFLRSTPAAAMTGHLENLNFALELPEVGYFNDPPFISSNCSLICTFITLRYFRVVGPECSVGKPVGWLHTKIAIIF
jgi:hypothetical protein